MIFLGMEGTYCQSGIYSDKMQDSTKRINIGAQISLKAMVTGEIEEQYINNPFQRMHQSIEDYPDFLDDIDDVDLTEID